jgi:hypothetical protein
MPAVSFGGGEVESQSEAEPCTEICNALCALTFLRLRLPKRGTVSQAKVKSGVEVGRDSR